MNDSHALALLLERHERTRDDALAAHRRAQVASDAATAQSEQLLVYRREYEQRWTQRFRSDATPDLLGCYQSFAQRLGGAVEQQRAVADHAAAQLERALDQVREAELRCAAVAKLIERRRLELRRLAERRDQKQTDEAAARAAWTRIGTTRPAPFL